MRFPKLFEGEFSEKGKEDKLVRALIYKLSNLLITIRRNIKKNRVILFKQTEIQPAFKEAKQIEQTPTKLNPPYILGASVIGQSHIRKSIPCQDACAYEILSSGWGVIAVADGVGSASKSDSGAKVAVETAVQTAKVIITGKKSEEIDYGEVIKEAIFSSRKVLEAKAREEQCDLNELACTMIIVLTYKDNIAVAHVGDGAVVAKTDKGLKLISEPEELEYVNYVVPITSEEWEKHLRIKKVSNVECIAVFTDGCQRAVLHRTENGFQPYDKFFGPLFTYAQRLHDLNIGEQEIKDLLTSEKMSKNSGDDKTLVVSVLQGVTNGY